MVLQNIGILCKWPLWLIFTFQKVIIFLKYYTPVIVSYSAEAQHWKVEHEF